MKAKHWIKILIYAAALTILTIVFTAFFSVPEARDVTGMYGFYLEEENSMDVILIGASPVHTGFYSPLAYEEQGFTSYAVSTGALSGRLYPSAFRETLETQDPDLFVVDLSGFCEPDQTEAALLRRWLDSIKKGPNRDQSILEYVPEEDWITYRFPILVYHSNWSRPRGCWNALTDKIAQKQRGYSVTKNFCTYTDIISDEITDKTVDFSEEGMAALDAFLAYLKEAKIRNVLFVRFPQRSRITDGDSCRKGIQMIRDAGYDVLDYCQEDAGLDVYHDFYDEEHLNIFGVQKLTSHLAAYIAQNYDIKKDFSDSCREKWDEAMAYNRVVFDKAERLTTEHANTGLYTQKDFLK